jgi:serine protease AprX
MEDDYAGRTLPVKLGLARLTLKPAALAKSHRPAETFNDATCPIIGDGDELGEFLVLVTPERLDRLEAKIQQTQGRRAMAHWTSISSFALTGLDHRLPQRERRVIEQRAAAIGQVRLKIRLPRFELFSPVFQQDFQQHLQAIPGIDASPYLELGDFWIYGATVQSLEHALAIAAYPFIERITIMPQYVLTRVRLMKPSHTPVQVASPVEDLPVVAVVDGGIDAASPLEALVWGRDVQILASEGDFDHGTAVAALVAAQNDVSAGMLLPRSRLLDVQIMKRDEEIDEDVFKMKLEQSVERYSDQIKIWNLSIASKPGPRPTEFSELGRYLDGIQKRHGILFFIAAGNCAEMHPWPYAIDEDGEEWIAAPGDSICNVTVGAYAPDHAPPDAYAQSGCPSPFTAHGPGPYSTPKPDVSAPGGNVTPSGSIGVPTMSRLGLLTELAGTSMAVPSVAGLASELLKCIRNTPQIQPDDELLVLKALLLHHAIRPTDHVLGGGGADFYGFGKLNSLEQTLGDPFWRSTTVLLATLYPDRQELLIDPFPYPDGLWRNGYFYGEIWLTMVSDPLLNPARRLEYVRSDVEVAFGCRAQGTNETAFQLTPLKLGNGYETSRIRDEHKWSPIKQYYGKLPLTGIRGDVWRLHGKLLLREKESQHLLQEPEAVGTYEVKFAIALTILDPAHNVEVSNQMVQRWRARGYQPIQIEVAQRIRAQFSAS